MYVFENVVQYLLVSNFLQKIVHLTDQNRLIWNETLNAPQNYN